jgi:hypothetical protein
VGAVLPPHFGAAGAQQSSAETISAITDIVGRWRDEVWNVQGESVCDDAVSDAPFMVVARAPAPGFVAVLREGATATLLVSGANTATGATTDAVSLLQTLKWMDAVATAQAPTAYVPELRAALDSISQWWNQHRASVALDMTAARAARTRRRIGQRIATALSLMPRHRRAQLSPVVARARDVIGQPLGAAAEHALAALASAPIADEQWLLGLATFGDLHRRAAREDDGILQRPPSLSAPVAALVVLVQGAAPSQDETTRSAPPP